eukprot:COSAG02_NODE_14225_length_1295_cov_2.061037_1_plen_62_part_00
MLFSGSDDGTIKVWSRSDGSYREEQTLTGHRHGVDALALDPTSGRLFSGSLDGTIKVWPLL